VTARRARGGSVFVGVLLSLVAPLARAEDISLALPKAPAGDHGFIVAGSDARGDGTLRARVGLDVAAKPLVVLTSGSVEYHVVESQVLLEPGVSFALWDRFLFAADLPIVVAESGGDRPFGATPVGSGEHGPGMGDLGVSARARIAGQADGALKASARAEAWLPTGNAEFASDPTVRFRPSLGVSLEKSRARGALEAGFLYRKSQQLPALLPVRVGPALTAGIAGAFAVDGARRVEVGAELGLSSCVGSGAKLFDPRSTAGQALVTTRVRLPLSLVVGAGAGPGIGQGPGAADLRALFSVTYSPEAPPPPPDDDGDGISDATDACPRVRGVAAGDPMMHGCPALPTDTDGDTISDVRDACPRRPGLPSRDPKFHGCPEQPPPPPPPAPPRAKLAEHEIVITEQVVFDTGTAVIRPESDQLLGEVAHVLREHPELTRVEVQGHTDNTGTPEFNRTLSQDRARAVVHWLIAHGIAAERLHATGHGTDVPLASNDTEEGRAKNRRVEFKVLERKGAAP